MPTYIKFSDGYNPIPYEIENIDFGIIPKGPINLNCWMHNPNSMKWFQARDSMVRKGNLYWSILDANVPETLKAAMLLLKGIECLPDISSVKTDK